MNLGCALLSAAIAWTLPMRSQMALIFGGSDEGGKSGHTHTYEEITLSPAND